MTCEVAVMNKRGIALAADSAVTIEDGDGDRKKIYYTAEKLFSLSPDLPIAIMTYGPADIMSVPWETVVKVYAQKLSGRRFDALAEYAQDFLAFIKGADWLFPPKVQMQRMRDLAYVVWSDLYKDKLDKAMVGKSRATSKETLARLAAIIAEDQEDWATYPELACVTADDGERFQEIYAKALDEVADQVFKDLTLTSDLKAALRQTMALTYQKEWFHPLDRSRIVIAGMGEREPFPVLLQYKVGNLAAGTLRYKKTDETRIDGDMDASVTSFAQDDIILSIIHGIHPRVHQQLIQAAARFDGLDKEAESEEIRDREERLATLVYEKILRPYADPLLRAVSALPRQDLAKMAESFVNLTAFLMRMTIDEDETVSEPVDVALLSKGDGFIWVKHKDVRVMAHA